MLLAVSSKASDVCDGQMYGTKLLHPANCSKYIVCGNDGISAIAECPNGMHFNRLTSQCDAKKSAGCYLENSITPLILRNYCELCSVVCDDLPFRLAPRPEIYSLNASSNCDTNVPTTTVPPTTPCHPITTSAPVTTISSTTKEICTSVPTTTPSPPTTTTGPITTTQSITTTSTIETTTESTPETTTAISIIDCWGEGSTDEICKNKPNYSYGYINQTCSKYYICINGNTIQGICPDDLQYSFNSNQCEYPQNVDCPCETVPGPSTGPSGITCEEPGKCYEKADGTLLANDANPNTYIICQCECELVRPCPSGLVFDLDLKSCTYPKSA